MDTSTVIENFRNLLIGGFFVISIPLVASLLVAVVFGILQAVMQIQEQTLSFFPKVLVLFGVVYFAGPWMFEELIKLFGNFLENIPSML